MDAKIKKLHKRLDAIESSAGSMLSRAQAIDDYFDYILCLTEWHANAINYFHAHCHAWSIEWPDCGDPP